MKTPRFLALALIALVAVASVPASTDGRGTCGIALTTDAYFKQFDRIRSVGAAKICAMYLNTIDAQLSR